MRPVLLRAFAGLLLLGAVAGAALLPPLAFQPDPVAPSRLHAAPAPARGVIRADPSIEPSVRQRAHLRAPRTAPTLLHEAVARPRQASGPKPERRRRERAAPSSPASPAPELPSEPAEPPLPPPPPPPQPQPTPPQPPPLQPAPAPPPTERLPAKSPAPEDEDEDEDGEEEDQNEEEECRDPRDAVDSKPGKPAHDTHPVCED
jgi:periplasmic protein TonB